MALNFNKFYGANKTLLNGISTTAESSNTYAKESTDSMQDISAAVREMVANIQSVTNILEKNERHERTNRGFYSGS